MSEVLLCGDAGWAHGMHVLARVFLGLLHYQGGGPYFHLQAGALYRAAFVQQVSDCSRGYRGTLLIRKCPPPRAIKGPYARAYCRDLGWSLFLRSEVPL